jgi:hypothetical protein
MARTFAHTHLDDGDPIAVKPSEAHPGIQVIDFAGTLIFLPEDELVTLATAIDERLDAIRTGRQPASNVIMMQPNSGVIA